MNNLAFKINRKEIFGLNALFLNPTRRNPEFFAIANTDAATRAGCPAERVELSAEFADDFLNRFFVGHKIPQCLLRKSDYTTGKALEGMNKSGKLSNTYKLRKYLIVAAPRGLTHDGSACPKFALWSAHAAQKSRFYFCRC